MRTTITLLSMLSIIIMALPTAIQTKLNELPIVVSVCSFNNAPWVERNLDSIFSQQYSNYRVIYIDDASTDDTVHVVQQYIDSHNLHDKITLQINTTRCRKMKNVYNCFHSCADEEIIMQVDGDDWLAHDQVFSLINSIYQNNDVWLTYGQFIGYPNNKPGLCKPVPEDIIENRAFRSWEWVYTHLRTFYAWLFKNIKLEDLISEKTPGFESKFFPLANDLASVYPMLEMCGNRFIFIPDILYIYNWNNPLIGGIVDGHLYWKTGEDIKNRPKYPMLQSPIINRLKRFEHAQADLILLSSNNPNGTDTFLHALSLAKGIKTAYVLYEDNDTTRTHYAQLQNSYPHIRFIRAQTPVTTALLNLLKENLQEHIVLARDTIFIQKPLDINECILHLEKTLAYGLFFGLSHCELPFWSPEKNEELQPHQHIYEDIYAWKFTCSYDTLSKNIDMTLFRKQHIQEEIAQMGQNAPTITSFIDAWYQKRHTKKHDVGIFFQQAKIEGNRAMISKNTKKPKQHNNSRLTKPQRKELKIKLPIIKKK